MNEYLDGAKLYGDDFSLNQIQDWYEKEAEGYSDLGSKDKGNYTYSYHQINAVHGFNKIKTASYSNVLGFGSAWGLEFEPILPKIKKLTIIEPSLNLRSAKIGDITPTYVTPQVDGCLGFEDNSFDLITCFGTLHHIPNVTFLLSELVRVLKPNGHLLLREPIISMGNWNVPRVGLTRNERGIPVAILDSTFKTCGVEIISKEYCFTMTSIFQKLFGWMINGPVYAYRPYVYFDSLFSFLLKSNVRYHAVHRINKIAPSSIFYVIRKRPN